MKLYAIVKPTHNRKQNQARKVQSISDSFSGYILDGDVPSVYSKMIDVVSSNKCLVTWTMPNQELRVMKCIDC